MGSFDLVKDGLKPEKKDKPAKKGKKAIREIRHRAAKKGYIVEHHMHGGHQMEEHPVADQEALMAHMREHQPELAPEAQADMNEPAEAKAGIE